MFFSSKTTFISTISRNVVLHMKTLFLYRMYIFTVQYGPICSHSPKEDRKLEGKDKSIFVD